MGGSGQAIQACDKQCITGLQFAEHLFELRPTTIKTRQFFLEDRVTTLALEVFDLAFQVLSGGGNSRIADQHGFTPLRLFWALNTEQSYGFRNVLFLRTEKIVPFIMIYGTFHPRHRTPLQRRCRNNRSHQADSDTLMKILPF